MPRARDAHGLAVFDLQTGAVRRIDFDARLWIEVVELNGASGAAVPVFEQASGGEDERIFLIRPLHGWYVFQRVKFAFAARETFGE